MYHAIHEQMPLVNSPAQAAEAVSLCRYPPQGTRGLNAGTRNADWGTEPIMLKFDKLQAEIQLLPLLSNEIVINRIVLSDADVLLETNVDGVGNWVMAFGGGNSSAPLPHIGEVQIDRLRIRYHEGESGFRRELNVSSLSAKTAGPGAPIDRALNATIADEPLNIEGQIGALRQFSPASSTSALTWICSDTSV